MAAPPESTVLVIDAATDSATSRFDGDTHVEHAADLGAARQRLALEGSQTELVVLCEAYPGQHHPTSIEALRRTAPLVRVWRLLGSWCEGEQRSGSPPAGCVSSYWHQWPPRATRELATANSDACPVWGLPLTATHDERALFTAEKPLVRCTGLVLVGAKRAETAAALADACRLGGYDARHLPDDKNVACDEPCVAIVWDTTIEQAQDLQRVADVRQRGNGAPLLAVVSFPRPDETQAALAAGVAAVISKPYLVRDLLWYVEQATTVASSSL